jgi:hypothetical protein
MLPSPLAVVVFDHQMSTMLIIKREPLLIARKLMIVKNGTTPSVFQHLNLYSCKST